MRSRAPKPVSIAFAATVAIGCHDEPAYDPIDYLAVGVDPTVEANREERSLVEHGYAITERIDGRTFVALSAMAPRSDATAVRVITSRGIAMGIDAPARDRPLWRSVALLGRPSGLDLDGDEEIELLVRVDDSSRPLPCIVVVRVLARGDVFEVPIDARAHGPRACPEEVVDVEGDGTIELLVGYRPWFVRGAPVPRMPIPFAGHAGTWSAASEATLQALADATVPQRIEDRNLARARADVREVVRLSLEIAWLDGRRGVAVPERRAAFAEAIAGLALDEPTTELVEAASSAFE